MSDPTVTPTPTEARQDEHGVVVAVRDLASSALDGPYATEVTVNIAPTNAFVEGQEVILAAVPSPAVSAPDLDAIRARAETALRGPGGEGGCWGSYPEWIDRALIPAVEDVPALLAALAAAHADKAGMGSAYADLWEKYDGARAALAPVRAEANRLRLALTDEIGKTVAAETALAALRERIEGLHVVRGEASDDGGLVTVRLADLTALAAAPSETKEGR